MAWYWTQETLKHACKFAGEHVCVETHTYSRDPSTFSFSCRHTWKSTAGERDETMSWFCHPQCVYPCIHVCVCWMCACRGMGYLCQWPCTMCHNISWSKSITENSFPSSVTVFDGSAFFMVTLQIVIQKAERVSRCWLPSIKNQQIKLGKVEEDGCHIATWQGQYVTYLNFNIWCVHF